MTDPNLRDLGLQNSNDSPLGRAMENPAIGQYYLLVIAIDHYANGFRALNNPVRDANGVVNVLLEKYRFNLEDPAKPAPDLRLSDPGRYGDGNLYPEPIPVYDDARICCLYNESATRKMIADKLAAMYARMSADDALLIYFSGHGVFHKNKFYLISADAQKDDYTSWFLLDNLYQDLIGNKGQQCRDLLLLLDCCFAGAASIGYKSEAKERFSRNVLACCLPDQKAWDGYAGTNSPFANGLIDFLKENSRPSFPFNSIPERFASSFKSVFEKVYDLQQELRFSTLPGIESGSGSFVFELREKDVPSIDHLSSCFVKHLNFIHQRGDFMRHYRGDNKDFVVLFTMGEKFELHQMQARVLVEEVKEKEKIKSIRSKPFDPSKFPDSDLWTSLAKSFGTAQPDKQLTVKATVQHLLGELVVDQDLGVSEPYFLMLGLDYANPARESEVVAFCKDLYTHMKVSKSLQENQGKQYRRFFVLVGNTRVRKVDADEEVKRLRALVGDGPVLVTTSRIKNLLEGEVELWHDRSKKMICSNLFVTYDYKKHFPHPDTEYDIQEFIRLVCKDLMVDYTCLTGNLWQ